MTLFQEWNFCSVNTGELRVLRILIRILQQLILLSVDKSACFELDQFNPFRHQLLFVLTTERIMSEKSPGIILDLPLT